MFSRATKNIPLIKAIKNKNYEVVKSLIENIENIDNMNDILEINYLQPEYNYTLLMLACEIGDLKIIELLLKKGSDVNSFSYNFSPNTGDEKMPIDSALSIACKFSDNLYKLLALLQRYNLNPSIPNNKPLWIIAHKPSLDKEMIKLLLNNGATDEYKPSLQERLGAFNPNKYHGSGSILLDLWDNLSKYDDGFHYNFTSSNKSENYQPRKNNQALVNLFLDKKVDFTARNKEGKNLLFYAYENNNEEITKLFLENGADEDSIYDNRITFLQHAELIESKKWFKSMIVSLRPNNPKALVKILKKFSKDERLKYTNHPWTDDLRYDKFNHDLGNGWKEIKDELQILSETLYKKINKFLFKTDENIGFSSSNITTELKKDVKPSSITMLNKLIDKFKQNIVIKPDEDCSLVDMFGRILEKTKLDLDINLAKIEDFNTKLFIDVESLESALVIILIDIHKKQSDAEIKVTIEENSDNKELINLKIIHIGSEHKPKSKELLDTIEKTGNFTSIYETLEPICYWAVEAECEDGKKRIEYLYPPKDNDKPHLISIPDKIEGFTHILRLYK